MGKVFCATLGCKNLIEQGADLEVNGQLYCFQDYNGLGDSHYHDAFKEQLEKKRLASEDYLEAKEALAFFRHLKNHKEVQNAPTHKGIPVCKICDKSSKEIALESQEIEKK